MIPVAEADHLLAAHRRILADDVVPLGSAVGRILREDVSADRDYPPADRVAMDGICIAHQSWRNGQREFQVQGMQRAGEPPRQLESERACIEVMTGAALPHGTDTVIRYEDLAAMGAVARARDDLQVAAGQNVHRLGSDARVGQIVLRTGRLLGPPEIAVLASIGMARVRVASLPKVALLSTGDELVSIHAKAPMPHQIRQSNGPALKAALLRHGFARVRLACSRDERGPLGKAIDKALARADVLVVSGGMSAGKFDYVPEVLRDSGVSQIFHKLRQKPGKPFWFGTAGDGRPVFGLPGNPVSALVCLYRYVLPHLRIAAGIRAPEPKFLDIPTIPARKNDFTVFVPVRREGDTGCVVRSNGSGDFLSLTESDGFAELPPNFDAGARARFVAW